MRDGEISPEIQRLPSEGKEAAEGGATQYNWHYEFVSVQGPNNLSK